MSWVMTKHSPREPASSLSPDTRIMAAEVELARWLSSRERMPLVHVVGTGASHFTEELASLVQRNAMPPFLSVLDPKCQFGDCWLPRANDPCPLEDALAAMIKSVWLVAVGGKETMEGLSVPLSIWQSITFDLTLMMVPLREPTGADFDAISVCAAARNLHPGLAIEVIKPERVTGAAWSLLRLMNRPAGLRRQGSGLGL